MSENDRSNDWLALRQTLCLKYIFSGEYDNCKVEEIRKFIENDLEHMLNIYDK